MDIKFLLVFCLLFSFALAANGECWDGTNGATHYWSLNETSGTNGWDWCGPNNLTHTGLTVGVVGNWDKAVNFTTVGAGTQSITSGLAWVDFQNDFSATFWVTPTGTAPAGVGHYYLHEQSNSWWKCAIMGATPNEIYCDAWDGGAKSVVTTDGVSAGNTYFVAFTYDKNNDINLYVNGSTANATTAIGTISGTGELRISVNLAGYGAYAVIDEARLFNYTLNTTEIENLYLYNELEYSAPAVTPSYDVINNTYSTPVYETNDTDFQLGLWINTTDITSVMANVSWNGTVYGTTSTTTYTNGDNTTYVFNYDGFELPLIETNNTAINQIWTYNLTWSNGTQTNHTEATNTQNVYWSHYFNSYTATSPVLEGQNVTLAVDLALNNGAAAVTALLNNTYYTLEATDWNEIATAPGITPYNENFTTNASMVVNFTSAEVGFVEYTRSSDNAEVAVYTAALVDCTLGIGTTSLNFTFYDEEDVTTPVAANLDGTFWVYGVVGGEVITAFNTTVSFNFTNTYNATICIFPSWATVEVDSWQSYYGNETHNNEPRAYFLEDAELTNVTEEINLYIINNSISTLFEITVDDDAGQSVNAAYIYFARYYPAENVYRTVAMVYTDDFGEGSTYLRPNDVWFRITVTQDGSVLATFTPQTAPCDPALSICDIYLSLAPETYLEYIEYNEDFSYSCAFNETGTNATVCSYTDTSGLMQYARLLVTKAGLFYPITICDTNLTTVSGSLVCSMGDIEGTYAYAFSAHFASEILLDSGEITHGNTGALFGTDGLLMSGFVIILVGLAGIHSAGAAIIMGAIGVIFAGLLGLLTIELSAIVAICVLAVVLYVKMK